MTTDYDQAVAKADADISRRTKYREQLIRVRTARQEIPSVWDTGTVSQQQLAKTYGVSVVTVKKILQENGRKVGRMKKLDPQQRAEIVEMLKRNENIVQMAAAYGVSQNTIRRIGQEEGALEKGKRKPRRSDAEYEQIEAMDVELKRRFGQGLYNLGIGLKGYHQRKIDKARALQHAQDSAPAKTSEPVFPVNALVEHPDTGEVHRVTGYDGNGGLITEPHTLEHEDDHPDRDDPNFDSTTLWPPEDAEPVEDPDTQLGGHDSPHDVSNSEDTENPDNPLEGVSF